MSVVGAPVDAVEGCGAVEDVGRAVAAKHIVAAAPGEVLDPGDGVVGSGAAALESLKARSFDCVVLDLRLPDISGFDLLSEIQQVPNLRDTPTLGMRLLGYPLRCRQTTKRPNVSTC